MTTGGVLAPAIGERLHAAGLPPLPRACWIEIDEAAVRHNVRLIRDLVPPGVALAPVVKADAYGHGAPRVARVLSEAGAERLCVASLDEGLALRASGITTPIVILFGVPAALAPAAAAAALEVVASDVADLDALLAASARAAAVSGRGNGQHELRVHLEVETGLQRAGIRPEAVAGVARAIAGTPGVHLAGVWSHLASPADPDLSAEQEARFERACASFAGAGVPVPARHLSASGGVFSGAPAYELVRPGLCIYGVLPDDFPVAAHARAAAAQLRPVMALKATPLRVDDLPVGSAVGYGGTWRAERAARIATLPVGYGDGWARASTPGAVALVRGRRVPLVGSVAMDAVAADVTDVPGVDRSSEFVLLGAQDGDRITAGELARVRTTIAWEVLAGMAYRVPRVYHAGSRITAMRTLSGETLAVEDGSR